jgi:uncharacterized BrkB/YihY/UPF0761 family membrane protein
MIWLYIGWVLNIISVLILIKLSIKNGSDISLGDLIGLGLLALFPGLLILMTICGYLDSNIVIFKGKKNDNN